MWPCVLRRYDGDNHRGDVYRVGDSRRGADKGVAMTQILIGIAVFFVLVYVLGMAWLLWEIHTAPLDPYER